MTHLNTDSGTAAAAATAAASSKSRPIRIVLVLMTMPNAANNPVVPAACQGCLSEGRGMIWFE